MGGVCSWQMIVRNKGKKKDAEKRERVFRHHHTREREKILIKHFALYVISKVRL